MLFKLKYLLVIFFLIAISFSCSRNNKEKKIKIGFSQCISDHPWRDAMNHSMKVQAALYPNVDLTIFEAKNDLQLQIDQINQMITDQYDVIVVSPMFPDKIVAVISKAYDQGIPIVIIDRKIESDKYTTYIGADNIEVGRNAGNFIASSSNGTTNVVELKIGDNASPSVERSQGFHEIVDHVSNINVIASINYSNTAEHGEILSHFLDSLSNQSIDFFYAFNDVLAYDSWRIARKKGIEHKIKFIGIDGLNNEDGGIELVRKGILEASILYPTGGAEAIKLAYKIANGEMVPKMNLLGTTVIDKNNAEIMKNQYDRINEQLNNIEQQTTAIHNLEDRYSIQYNLLKTLIGFLAVILSLTIYSIYSIITIRKKSKQLQLTNDKIIIQRNQIEKIANEVKISNEAKLNFFTGLSHEFKTPLTLILSSVESLYNVSKEKGYKLKYEVELIHNNANRLLRLINNLLDFRKVEDKNFNIRASNTNVFDFAKNIYNDFEREARKRNIKFTLDSNNKALELFIDRNLMDKVFFNLLSNAFKFTPDNGKIQIYIEDIEERNNALIHIKDSGIGIPKEELSQVFEPFFNGSNNRKNSSGIGLHLSKQFIDLHLGKIEVKSLHGTEFSISLYKGNTHFKEDQIVEETEIIESDLTDFNTTNSDSDDFMVSSSDGEKPALLIIEDNQDLSLFLSKKLNSEYEIFLSDGSDAIEKALEIIPDIIICDINLPHKNGFEICEIVKNDLSTSHIPIIMLTALSNKESYIQGLKSGADLYLTKPFNYSILNQSLKSLLYNRDKLRYYYTNNLYKIDGSTSFGNSDHEFIAEINNLIKQNLDNTSYSVEDLAENLNISRVQLYRKVKAILDINISDYINNYRLENAKFMLENSSLRISEIAYQNGFSSPNYFSTAFKIKYGLSPVSYRKSK